MNAPSTSRACEASPMAYLGMVAIACGVFVSAPAVVLGIALARVAAWARIEFAILAAFGAAWTALSWPLVELEMERAQRAAVRAGALEHPHAALAAAWPHVRTWWLVAAPLCFALALAIAILRRRSVEELRERDERRSERARTKAEGKARRALGIREPRRRVDPTFELGQHVSGDHVLPDRDGRVLMPLSRLQRTVLVIGAPGSGKTVTLARLAYGVATRSDWQVVVIDAKGDEGTQAQFAASMRRAGRSVRLFPQEPYDAWRGTGREIANGERMARMVEVVRSYGAAVVLAPQAFEGMGGPEAAARILNAAHTIILHAVPDPDAIIKAAGTRMATEWSLQHERGISTDVGSTRTQHQMRVDPNEVRRLQPGMGFVIGNGKGQKLQIAATPRADDPPPRRDIFAEPVWTTDDPEPEGPIRL